MIHINKVREITGVTVRTLRYYDKIGLLQPASKTQGGHRLYTINEIKKLQQIQFFKKIGFSLNEIDNMLTNSDWDWSEGLKGQLSFVLKEQRRLKKIELSLKEIIHGIAIEGEDNWNAIKKIMQLSVKDKEIQQSYRESIFDEKEKKLLEKLPKMTSENSNSLEWIGLIGQLKRFMKDGPESHRVQNIIRRMEEKRLEDFEGEDEFLDKLWEIRKSPQQSEKLSFYPIDEDLLKFMDDAYAIYLDRLGKEEIK
ncbi:MerR family transcriptional regulator [Heyndrickxia sp. NPDC080065]|uniref:MerR family transcriptional regulator n=1 Tax=Heyndrickxia sp. NPDC080065 TaxID=3390568 RepID=UPI003D02D87E